MALSSILRHLLLLVLVLVVFSPWSTQAVNPWKWSIVYPRGNTAAPCGPVVNIETPNCTVVADKEGYELRNYPPGEMWVETVVTGLPYSRAIGTGFRLLFAFISGDNESHEKIEMTGPVRIRPLPDQQAYAVSFFVPSKYKTPAGVPAPANPAVKIVTSKGGIRAVYGPFGGFPREVTYQEHANELASALDEAGIKYDPHSLVYAGYSSPFRLWHRKQEVWLDVLHDGDESKSTN